MRTVIVVTLAAFSFCLTAEEQLTLRRGHLVIHGGGGDSREPLDEFVRLAGGSNAKVVVIPTAAGRENYDDNFQVSYFRPFRERGVVDIRLLHTPDRRIANSDEFVAPLANATGVWFTGGRQWRLADVLDTKTEAALWAVLARGGVIGGGSAGATIQGSYLVRGDTRGALLPMGDHERGFGFLKNSAIDQHFLVRNRHFDLIPIIRSHPELLGLGLDADVGVVVTGDEFRVIGLGYVAVYDPKLILANGAFYFMQRGERFRLSTRTPMSANGEPLWLPHIQPRAALTSAQLRDVAGEYRVGDDRITIRVSAGRLHAMLCVGDERELVPISREVFYDSADGSKITMQRNNRGAVTGLTWEVARTIGQQTCRQGTVQATKGPAT